MKKRSGSIGQVPGHLVENPHAQATKMRAFVYTEEAFKEFEPTDLGWVDEARPQGGVIWLDIEGLADLKLIQAVGDKFELHRLALEDVTTTGQRTKIEMYPGHLFIVVHALTVHKTRVSQEQINIFLGSDFVITIQEGKPDDPFGIVRDRIRKENSPLRRFGPDYLAYALLDAVVDGYFPVLEELGELLDRLEEAVIAAPDRRKLSQMHFVKRDLLCLRRAAWPLRDCLAPLTRDEDSPFGKDTRIYLRDTYDHTIEIIDLTENYREIASSLVDVYLSSTSNRMNEVMKVLTIISTIFVPLTFIAGVYGMNFKRMPELEWYWGYPTCLLLMALIAGGEIYYFYRKGWFAPTEAPVPKSHHQG